MASQRTVTFDFDFDYPNSGAYGRTNKVTVSAPSFSNYEVYSTMQGYVSQALLNFAKLRGETAKSEAEVEEDETETKDDEPDDRDVMVIMAMGLGVDAYPKFASYVKRVLTNSRLAVVGEPGDTIVKITDEVWDSIVKEGGMDSAQKIMSEFTGFFFDALASKGKSGPAKSPTRSSPTVVASPTNTRSASRGRNSSA